MRTNFRTYHVCFVVILLLTLVSGSLYSSGNSMISIIPPKNSITKVLPGYPSYLKVGSNPFNIAVEIWQISATNNSKSPLQSLGFGCSIYSHLNIGHLPQIKFNPIPVCMNSKIVELVFDCDSDACKSPHVFEVPKKTDTSPTGGWSSSFKKGSISGNLDLLGRQSSNAKINLDYNDSSSGIVNSIKNATLEYDGTVFFCSTYSSQCESSDEFINSLSTQ
jgi:hypothetical protein